MRKIIVFILFLFIFNINIKAACNNKELLDNADKVNITVLPQTSEEKDYYFLIRVENIKENMALVISDNDTNESKTYRYSDTNEGTLELINNYIFAKVTYTVKVYSVDSSCQNMLLKTLKASTIKFNDYSKYDACDGYEEFELCKPFYDGKHVSKEVFNNALEEYKKEKETTFFEKIIKIIKEYYLYVLLPIAIISACYYTYIGVIKWRKRK